MHTGTALHRTGDFWSTMVDCNWMDLDYTSMSMYVIYFDNAQCDTHANMIASIDYYNMHTSYFMQSHCN